MKKERWMAELAKGLKNIDVAEKEEILRDYEEYFFDAMESGRSEEEITESLGNPKRLAKQLRADSNIKRAKKDMSFANIIKATFGILTLSFFNLTIMIGPIIALLAIVFSIVVVGVSLFGSGLFLIGLSIGGFLGYAMLNVTLAPLIVFFIGTLLASLGGIIFILGYYLSKVSLKFLMRYVKFNVDFVKGKD